MKLLYEFVAKILFEKKKHKIFYIIPAKQIHKNMISKKYRIAFTLLSARIVSRQALLCSYLTFFS